MRRAAVNLSWSVPSVVIRSILSGETIAGVGAGGPRSIISATPTNARLPDTSFATVRGSCSSSDERPPRDHWGGIVESVGQSRRDLRVERQEHCIADQRA